MLADLACQFGVGGAGKEPEALVFAQVAGPLALRGWLCIPGLCRILLRFLVYAVAVGVYATFRLLLLPLLQSLSPLPYPTPSKLVGFGCSSGTALKTWLGDQDSNLDKCLQRALSYH